MLTIKTAMKQTEYITIRLEADKGMMLTQATEVDPMERVVGTVVYIGVGDSPDNWVEIPAEQGELIKQAQMELAGIGVEDE